jgi:hypothetical protein
LTLLFLYISHPGEVIRAAAGARPGPIAVAIALVVVDRFLMAHRWFLLVRAADPSARPPRATLVRLFLVSTFLGTFLPTGVGGDAIRAYGLARANVPSGRAAASVVMDRLLGVLSLALVAAAGLVGARDYFDDPRIIMPIAVAILLCVIAAGLAFSARAMRALQGLAARLPGARLRRLLGETLVATHASSRNGGVMAIVFVESVAVQVLRVLQAYCLGASLGLPAPLSAYLALVPLILFVMLLPISINGIGTSQAAFVLLFGFVGIRAPDAFLLSVLFVGLGIVGNLPGGLLYAFSPARAPDRTPGR